MMRNVSILCSLMIGWVLPVGATAQTVPLIVGEDAAEATIETLRMTVSEDAAGKELHSFWGVDNWPPTELFVNSGPATKFAERRPMLRAVNCVRLMGGKTNGKNVWFKGVRDDGTIDADFTGMISILRNLQDGGLEPMIVLDNVPTSMSAPGKFEMYGNTLPPKDEKVWAAYIEMAVREMVKAFGIGTVSTWRFRVGTEPDINPHHWQGTKEEYLKHYDYTVDAVCRVIPDADIGPGNILNPNRLYKIRELVAAGDREASPFEQWGLDIIDHCAVGKNYVTGKRGTRMEFFQCSWYTRVGNAAKPQRKFPVAKLENAVRLMRERLDKYPQFRNIPIDIAEFGALYDENEFEVWGESSEWSSSFMAAIAEVVYRINIREIHQWMMTTGGVLHPKARLLELLGKMVDCQQMTVKVEPSPMGKSAFGSVAAKKAGAFYVLLYNHHEDRNSGTPKEFLVAIEDGAIDAQSEWKVRQWRIDRDHGSFIHQFNADAEEAGLEPLKDTSAFGARPSVHFGMEGNFLFHLKIERYQELSQVQAEPWDDALKASGDGQLDLKIVLPTHGVALLEISRSE